MTKNKIHYCTRIILVSSFCLIFLSLSVSIVACGQVSQSQVMDQLDEMNRKINELSSENTELKEKLAQQGQETVRATETEPPDEEAWYYINLFPDNSGDVETLEEAIEKIQPGGTIYLNPGMYYPEKNLDISKPLSLIGSGTDKTYLIYNSEPNIIEYTGEGLLSISDLALQRDGSEWGDVIWIKSGRVNITNCAISGATHFEKEEGSVGGGMGILIWGETAGSIKGCTIENNSVDGVHIRNQSYINLEDNIINDNVQYGISYWDETAGTVLYNECFRNESGIHIRDMSIPKIISNLCKNNTYSGIEFYGEMNTIAVDNYCSENDYHGISVGWASEPTLVENYCYENVEVGIVFFEESGGFAALNDCFNNEYGIYITKDSNPALGENTFSGNNQDIEDAR